VNTPWLVFLVFAVVLEGTSIIGLVRRRRERNQNRRRRAAFIGFGAATVASGISVLSMAVIYCLRSVRYRYIGPLSEDVLAISSILQHSATFIAFCSGLLSGGGARIFLLCYGPVMFFLYTLFAFGNFGS
jgi:hypothetical protein